MVNEGSINLEKVDKLYEAYDSTRSDLMGKLMELGVEIEILGNQLPHDQVATNRAQLEDTEKALDNLEMRFKDQTQPYIDQLKIKYADHPETIMQNPLDFLFFNYGILEVKAYHQHLMNEFTTFLNLFNEEMIGKELSIILTHHIEGRLIYIPGGGVTYCNPTTTYPGPVDLIICTADRLVKVPEVKFYADQPGKVYLDIGRHTRKKDHREKSGEESTSLIEIPLETIISISYSNWKYKLEINLDKEQRYLDPLHRKAEMSTYSS